MNKYCWWGVGQQILRKGISGSHGRCTFNFSRKCQTYAKGLYHFTFPLAGTRVPVAPQHLQHLIWSVFLNRSHSNEYAEVSHCISPWLMLLNSFSCACLLSVSLLWCLFASLPLFSLGCLCFYWVVEVHYLFWAQVFYPDICFASIFSQSVAF